MDEVEQVADGVTSAFWDFVTTYQIPIRIAVIIVIAVLLHWALRRLLRRTVDRVVHGVKKSQKLDSTQEIPASPQANARAIQRARALGGVGGSVITWVVVVVTIAMVLGQLGFDLTAVLASAGVLAAALAFGAQNIVKDLLNGIFMVFEDQVGVGDWVTIGTVSGTVEDVGIRITKVRAIDGTLWFVRNGEVLSLGNSSQGWGQALIDVTVEAGSDLAEVEQIAVGAARELLASPQYARKIIGEPEVWGVENVAGDRATLRLAMRTRPEQQWSVQRAMRASLAERFAEANIQLATTLPDFTVGGK